MLLFIQKYGKMISGTWIASFFAMTEINILNIQFNHHRTMIRPHLILQILYIASFCKYRIISPESIDSPAYISITGTSYWIPPRVYFCKCWVFYSPDILPTIGLTGIEPCSFHRMKSDLSIIFLGSRQIDRMMSTIDISTPENPVSLCSKRMCVVFKFSIKYKFSLPCLFRFSSIREVNSKYINNISRTLVRKSYMCHSSLVGGRISWKTRSKCNIKTSKHSRMDPYSCTCISCFFCWIVVCLIWFWSIEI